MKKKIFLAILPALVLLVLGGLNIYKKITWREPSDGVTWKNTSEGLTAAFVEIDSPAYLASIRNGDILLSINAIRVNNQIDVAKNLWMFWETNQPVRYEIIREGESIFPRLNYIDRKSPNLIYFYLALIGLTTLVIGSIVFFRARRPFSLPFIFFSLVSLAFYAFNIFSPTGALDPLDYTFYWLDKIAFLAFPPLLLHFFVIFPRRKTPLRDRLASVHFLYLPGSVLLLVKIFINLPNIFRFSDSHIIQFYQTSEKLDMLHFALFSMATLGIIFHDTIKVTNILQKTQLKWIVYGLGFGIIPFTAFYIFPYLIGAVPSKTAELTVILQALIPLTFAYSISRYRLLEVEVILKKAMPLIFSYVFIALLYFIVSSQTNIFAENRLNALILGILAIILGTTLFTPVKKFIQFLLERAIYKRSYKFRRTLLTISQELSRERDLQKLSQSLLERIANALSLKYIALLLPEHENKHTFYILRSRGSPRSPKARIHFDEELYLYLKKSEYLSDYILSDRKVIQKKFRKLADYNCFHLMPLKVEDELIGCLAMGKKHDNTLLASEDWELLCTISSPMALALENAYLYNQAHIRALELERLKDYSENIIESLTVGVAVLDQKGKIIGWNRVLEEIFKRKKGQALGKELADVLGKNNYASLFPPDTQKDYRLMSEILMEMPTGGRKIFDIAKTPLLDNKMNPYGTIIVFEDTTEKISLQQQLVTSEKLASVGLLSAGVAHEINTPLTGISSYVQMLQKKLPESPHSQILEKIEAQTERVARIVKNLLNFSRNPSESMFYQVDLKECLGGILSLIDYKLKNMKIELDLNLDSLPSIWAQGERLQQVFINIILNAIDAMPNGGTLKIELYQEYKQAVVKIKDTGTGIKRQHMANIFDPFFTTKGIGKGTGLGLSISYAIIKEHEGRISVESKSGKGSLFTITIPMDLDTKEKTKSIAS